MEWGNEVLRYSPVIVALGFGMWSRRKGLEKAQREAEILATSKKTHSPKPGNGKTTGLEKMNAAVLGAALVTEAIQQYPTGAKLNLNAEQQALLLAQIGLPLQNGLTGSSFCMMKQLEMLHDPPEPKVGKDGKKEKFRLKHCHCFFLFFFVLEKYIMWPLIFVDRKVFETLMGKEKKPEKEKEKEKGKGEGRGKMVTKGRPATTKTAV